MWIIIFKLIIIRSVFIWKCFIIIFYFFNLLIIIIKVTVKCYKLIQIVTLYSLVIFLLFYMI